MRPAADSEARSVSGGRRCRGGAVPRTSSSCACPGARRRIRGGCTRCWASCCGRD